MAKLSPSIDVIKRQKVQPTEGEWTLLNFLFKNLDDTYEIYFQPYINGDNPDFAIMRKGSGVLLIEVKDWDLNHYYIDTETKWRLFKNNALIKSPLNQVENYKSNLFNLHIDELFNRNIQNKNCWATVNCAIYFHNASEQQLSNFILNIKTDKYESYQKFVGYFELLGYDSLNTQRLNSLLTKFWLNKSSYYFDEKLYNSFQRYLSPPIHQIEDGIQINYTDEQLQLIKSEIRPRRKIKGVAGSGKTLVLAKRAVNAHKRTGGWVLILTYNLSLKNYIHDKISDVRENFNWTNFHIGNYHNFFKTQANNYNLEIENLSAWQDIVFFEEVKNNIKKYDVVFIDEIQDYMQAWIDIITTYFMHSDTEFVVFGDEKQNIYERALDENNEPIVRTIPGKWNASLNVTHRFGSNIGNIAIKFQKLIFSQKYNADELKIMSQINFAQQEQVFEYHYFNSFTADILFKKIYSIIELNKIHSSDVGILGSKIEILRAIDYSIRTIKHEKTTIAFESQEEYLVNKNSREKIEILRRLRKNNFYMKTGTIKLSTIHSFKGWEIDTVFLFIEKEDEEKELINAELIYTGLTRAKKNLLIFNLGNKKYDGFFKQEIDTNFEYK